MKEGAAYQAAGAGQQIGRERAGRRRGAGLSVETPRQPQREPAKAAAAAPGLTFPRFFTEAGVDPFDEVEWELRVGGHRQRTRRGRLRAARRRDSEVLVAAGHQHRRLEVFPRPDRHAGARAQRQAADRPRRRHDHRVGARAQVLRERRGPAGVQRRSEAHPRLPEGGVQQPGLVQLRLREGAAVLGLLHQLGAGHDGLDPDAGADRGHAVQVRIGHRHATCRRSARRRNCWPAAARRRARCRS